MNRFLAFFLISLGVASFFGCDKTPEEPLDSFDRQALLVNTFDHQILPAFSTVAAAADELQIATEAFLASVDVAGLQSAQQAWKGLALAWQAVSPYPFGPSENTFGTFQEDLGTFPTDTVKMEQYIAVQDTTLANFDRDTRGIFGMEYLLFAGADQASIAKSFAGPEGATRAAYLRAILRDIHQRSQQVSEDWAAYRSDFLANGGTDAGSSTSALYNGFVASFEALKNAKVGLPAGMRPGQIQAEPQLVEAYFSGESTALIEAHLAVLIGLWSGNTDAGGDQAGFEEYLEAVVGGADLILSTKEQIENVKTALANIPSGRLSGLMAQGDSSIETLHTELQKLTRFFKSDMSSLLGISITFDSGDGD